MQDTHAASWFLQSQASWLVHGLDRADDTTAVSIVLGRHEAGHATWVTLIADVERVDAGISAELSSLYALHGRVVGCLERGPDPRLCREVHLQVRRLLRSRLLALTASAVERICGLDEVAPRSSATA